MSAAGPKLCPFRHEACLEASGELEYLEGKRLRRFVLLRLQPVHRFGIVAVMMDVAEAWHTVRESIDPSFPSCMLQALVEASSG